MGGVHESHLQANMNGANVHDEITLEPVKNNGLKTDAFVKKNEVQRQNRRRNEMGVWRFPTVPVRRRVRVDISKATSPQVGSLLQVHRGYNTSSLDVPRRSHSGRLYVTELFLEDGSIHA